MKIMHLNIAAERLGKSSEAIKCFDEALRNNYAESWNPYINKAIELTKKATDIDSKYGDAWFNLIRIRQRKHFSNIDLNIDMI